MQIWENSNTDGIQDFTNARIHNCTIRTCMIRLYCTTQWVVECKDCKHYMLTRQDIDTKSLSKLEKKTKIEDVKGIDMVFLGTTNVRIKTYDMSWFINPKSSYFTQMNFE